MKRILVFSDSHGRTRLIDHLLKTIPQVDYVFFLGDHQKDIYPIEKKYPEISFYSVPGNTDYSLTGPDKLVVEIDGVRMFLAHGHQYHVKMGSTSFYYRTLELKCRVGVYGHTHKSALLQHEEVLLLNPGSISDAYGNQATYGIIETEGGKVSADVLAAPIPND